MAFINSFFRDLFDPSPMPIMTTATAGRVQTFSATRRMTPDLLQSSFSSISTVRSTDSASRRVDRFSVVIHSASDKRSSVAFGRNLNPARRRSQDDSQGYPRAVAQKPNWNSNRSQNRSSSVHEGAWINSLRASDERQDRIVAQPQPAVPPPQPPVPEKLLPAIPKSSLDDGWKPFERINARSRNRGMGKANFTEEHRSLMNASTHPGTTNATTTTTTNAMSRRKDSFGLTSGKKCKSAPRLDLYGKEAPEHKHKEPRVKKPSYNKHAKEDLARFIREQGLDTTLCEEILREVVTKDPGVKWKDIAGLSEAKSLLQEAVVLPLVMPDFFRGIRRPWKGILMIGPPGTGKTLLAKAVATECRTTFFNVSSSSLTSKFRGESEKLVRHLFKIAEFFAPSIIFIDEVDALCSQRGTDSEHEASKRFKAELLMLMDGLSSIGRQKKRPSDPKQKSRRDSRGLSEDDEIDDSLDLEDDAKTVMVLAATNHPWLIDDAFRRRFEKRILIDLPDETSRLAMLQLCLERMELEDDVNLEKLAKTLEFYSGADIATVCRDAAMMSLRRAIKERGMDMDALRQLNRDEVDKPISYEDLTDAAHRCRRTCSETDRQRYQDWMHKYGSE